MKCILRRWGKKKYFFSQTDISCLQANKQTNKTHPDLHFLWRRLMNACMTPLPLLIVGGFSLGVASQNKYFHAICVSLALPVWRLTPALRLPGSLTNWLRNWLANWQGLGCVCPHAAPAALQYLQQTQTASYFPRRLLSVWPAVCIYNPVHPAAVKPPELLAC